MRNGWRVGVSGNVFTDNRQNGTPAVINNTASRQGASDVAGGLAGGLLSARVFAGTQGYDQTFSAVSADRTSEDLNRRQRVPTRVQGTAAQWVRLLGRHTVLVGAEAKIHQGRDTRDATLSGPRAGDASTMAAHRRCGPRSSRTRFSPSDRFTMVMAVHGDRWHTQSKNTGYDKTLGSFNPRASVVYRVRGGISLRGSAYQGFRAANPERALSRIQSGQHTDESE